MKALPLRVECDSLRSFLDRYAPQLTKSGMTLSDRVVRAVGSVVEFEIVLKEDYPLLKGVGQVVEVFEGSGREQGEGPEFKIKFLHVDKKGREFIKNVVKKKRMNVQEKEESNG